MEDMNLIFKNYNPTTNEIDRDAVYDSPKRVNNYQALRPIMDNIEDNKGVYVPFIEQKQQPLPKQNEIDKIIKGFGTWENPNYKGWLKSKRILSHLYSGICYHKETNNKVVFATPKGFIVGDIKVSNAKRVHTGVSVNYDVDDNINVSGGVSLHGGNKEYYDNFYLYK